MSIFRRCATAVLLLGSCGACADPALPPVVLTAARLADLIAEARTNHPALRAAAARERAASQAVDAVRTWGDPTFRFGGFVAGDPGPDLEEEGDLQYGVEQPLPLFGKAAAERRAAAAARTLAGADAGLRDVYLRRDVAQAAYRLALAEETLAVGEQDLVLLDRMVASVRERQAAGLNAELDFLRLENERQRRAQQQVTDRLGRDFERATLNRQLARPPTNAPPAFALPPVAPEIPLTGQLYEMVRRFEPRLQVLREQAGLAAAEAERTRRNRRPDVILGVDGRQWTGSGAFREGYFGVSLNLPWFNGRAYRAELERDLALAGAAEDETADYRLEVDRELFRVWSRIDASRREALLYRDSIIPRSARAVESALATWAAGRGGFLDVLDARRMLTEARLMLARAIAEQHAMIAELITCCGVGEEELYDMLAAVPGDPPPSPVTETPPTTTP
ncbi:MAG: TolC family protein [Limisphaerales bacterium]